MSDQVLAKVYNFAIRALTQRARSVKELKDKLLAKDSPPEIVEEVIQKLLSQKLLNDAQFASDYIRYQLSKRPLGERALSFRLHHLGVDADTIKDALRKAFEGPEMALELAKRAIKAKNYSGLDPRKRDAKIARFLAARGFSYSTIRSLIDASRQKE